MGRSRCESFFTVTIVALRTATLKPPALRPGGATSGACGLPAVILTPTGTLPCHNHRVEPTPFGCGSPITRERQPDGQIVNRAAEVNRAPNARPEALLSLVRASFETKMPVDARTHLLPQPVDISIQGILDRLMVEYADQQLPGSYMAAR
ncbi:MAG TPA: hypothetical protein VFY29_09105 [Terriglobia bacterium]|nr:hypothetical protein [Terriglobia bacterium]